MIYVNVETQKKLLPLMHYALNPGGLLILGTAESIGGFGHLFSPLDKKWKVFQRREVPRAARHRNAGVRVAPRAPRLPAIEKAKEPDMDIFYAAQRVLLDSYGPPSVVVTAEGDIIYVNGRTGKYLEPSSGKVNVNVFAMAREGLREELGIAIHNAATRKTTVTTSGVRVKSNGGFTTINLTVRPLAEPAALRGMFLVVFEETARTSPTEPTAKEPTPSDPTVPPTELEEELRRTRERLQTTVEEMQATQEELRSANEELQSNNEELQSTNEEMTSSKEELQSLNEEMQTVNAELQTKIEELSQSNSDMKNLLERHRDRHDLPGQRPVRQAVHAAGHAGSSTWLPATWGGRSSHFATNLKYDRLVQDAKEVLDTLVPKEAQVQASDGRWYNMRILPYRTADNVIDGVVMTFADITAMKQTGGISCRTAREYAESIIATIREPLVVLDGELRIVSASRSFYETFQVTPAETEGRLLYEIGQRQWDIPSLRQLLEDILPKNTQFRGLPGGTRFSGHRAQGALAQCPADRRRKTNSRGLILLAMEDITESSATPK